MSNRYDAHMEGIGTYWVPGGIPISQDMIEAVEREIGYTLPDDYRHFIEKYGFSCQRGYTKYPDLKRPGKFGGGVEVFYGINPENSRDLIGTYKGYEGRIPPTVLPIAESPGGEICLGLGGEVRGKVFWWDRSESRTSPHDNLELIGHDFDSFIRSLAVKVKPKM